MEMLIGKMGICSEQHLDDSCVFYNFYKSKTLSFLWFSMFYFSSNYKRQSLQKKV